MSTVRVYIEDGVTYEVTTRPADPPAPSPVPVTAARVQMTGAPVFAGDTDGPTWRYANRNLGMRWQHVGGDWRDANDVPQGANPAAAISVNGAGDYSVTVTALVARLLKDNTGIFLHGATAEFRFCALTGRYGPPPRLHIITDAGTFDPTCIIATWINPSSTQPGGNDDRIVANAIVKFDLSAISGTVASATLTLNVPGNGWYQQPGTVAIDWLEAPLLGADPVGGKPGIAAAVVTDKALAAHPSVLIYDDLVSKQYIADAFGQSMTGTRPNLQDDTEIVQWPQFGLSAARVWGRPSYSDGPGHGRLIAWHHWAEPRGNYSTSDHAPKPWQRDFGNGHTHLFFRYLLEIGADVMEGTSQPGAKLPGMCGTYNWGNSAVTTPVPPEVGIWEGRLYQTGPSKANPHHYQLGVYFYGVANPDGSDNNYATHNGRGNEGQGMWDAGMCLRAGRVYSIEQEVKLNTLSGNDRTYDWPHANANANADGEMRVWVDGVLVLDVRKVKFRAYDEVRIQDAPFLNIYHGGVGAPIKDFHYDIGGICVATEYIGPPKELLTPPHPADPPTAEPPPVVDPPAPPPPPAGSSKLALLAASMQSGTWAELVSDNADATIAVGTVGDTLCAIPYAGAMPWNPVTRTIHIAGSDHMAPSRYMVYDDATNRWSYIGPGAPGTSHAFQHTAVNPFTGDVYTRNGQTIARWAGAAWVDACTIPENVTQVITVAIGWWSGVHSGAGAQGALTVHSGNSGAVYLWDPLSNAWTIGGYVVGQNGYYHGESAYSAKKNCMIAGGGNGGMGQLSSLLYRINADKTSTRMPDAPHPIGINHGMTITCDSVSGNFLAMGFGELWELNPDGVGTWTRLDATVPKDVLDPATGAVDPYGQPAAGGSVGVDCATYGVTIYVDCVRTRSPQARMHVYKRP